MSKAHRLPADFVPAPQDVLCGRGNAYASRIGNKLFSDICRDHFAAYQQASSRMCKSQVVATVVKQITLQHGTRFVKRVNGHFYMLSSEQAHDKTGHAIRDALRLEQQQQQKPNGNNKTTLSPRKFTVPLSIKSAMPMPPCDPIVSSSNNSTSNNNNGTQERRPTRTSSLFSALFHMEENDADMQPLPVSSRDSTSSILEAVMSDLHDFLHDDDESITEQTQQQLQHEHQQPLRASMIFDDTPLDYAQRNRALLQRNSGFGIFAQSNDYLAVFNLLSGE